MISNTEELISHCRIAAARGEKFLIATRKVIEAFTTPDYKEPDVDVMGIKVIEQGKEEAVARKMSVTVEELLFG